MGRYTSVQTYSDNNPNVAAQSYEQATGRTGREGKDDDDGAAAKGGVSVVPGGAKVPKLRTEHVENVAGSTAGAGSGEFHVYRAQRRREYTRLENMDKDAAAVVSGAVSVACGLCGGAGGRLVDVVAVRRKVVVLVRLCVGAICWGGEREGEGGVAGAVYFG